MLLDDLQPDELLVDAFPGGILGELCGIELPPARLIARALRWDAYARRLDGPLPEYDVVHALEPLGYDPPGPVESLSLPHAAPGRAAARRAAHARRPRRPGGTSSSSCSRTRAGRRS